MSTVPAVLDALVQAARLALPGVQVVDGQPVAAANDVLCIGFTGDPAETVVEATADLAQMAMTPDRERYAVTCYAVALRGGTDPQAVRQAVFGMVEAFRVEIARDCTLRGLVMTARLSVLDLTQQQTPKGALAELRFAVSIDAFAR